MDMIKRDINNSLTLKYLTARPAVKLVRYGRLTLPVLLAVLVLLPLSKAFSQSTSSENSRRNPYINEIIFTGNQSYSDKELKKRMHTKEPSFSPFSGSPG